LLTGEQTIYETYWGDWEGECRGGILVNLQLRVLEHNYYNSTGFVNRSLST
jgi:hypothetical protein